MFGIAYIILQQNSKVNTGGIMKQERNILIAFILNLIFSVAEFIGGALTGSIAIVSDAVHDLGDAASIGISFYLERKSKRKPDEAHSFGYARYSVIGGLITTLVLIFGSTIVIINAFDKLRNPREINYDRMIIFAFIGIAVNLVATIVTRGGHSVNQKAVSLHMLEDVLGWVVVLIGAIVMRFSRFSAIDPIISIGISLFILINAFINLKDIFNIFLDKTPNGISVAQITERLMAVEGVSDVHHVHIRSIDGNFAVATLHIVTNSNAYEIKEKARGILKENGIAHATIETETENEPCEDKVCLIAFDTQSCHKH